MQPDASFMRDLIIGFESEALDLVGSVTGELLSAEKSGMPAVELSKIYERICRSLHTLKGSAATCGLTEVSQLSHRLEDLVQPFKSGGGAIAPESVDLLLSGLDAVTKRVRLHAREEAPPTDPEWDSLMGEIEAASRATSQAAAPLTRSDIPSATEEEVGRLDLEGGWKVDARQVIQMMQDVERLRELKLRLSDQSRRLRRDLTRMKSGAGRGDLEGMLFSLEHALVFNAEETGNLVDSLEERLKDISMLSFETIAQPLQRQVRDLCRQLGKQATLSVTGGEVLLDRRILEGLKGPLVHLVRNALDHGLETPEKRDAAGKHKEGSLVVRVELQGNLLFLEVSDDGAGIDAEKVRQEALKRQMFSKEELAQMGEAQLRDLLFHSGFSTRSQVTSLSGRGVGLDVVKSQVAALQGTVEIQSKLGQGTRFILTLPVELGSSPVLILRVGSQLFGLPMLSAQNILRAHPEALKLSREQWELEVEGRTLPLKDLGELLHLRLAKRPSSGDPLILISTGDREFALSVDEVLGDENLVLHPLPQEFSSVEAFQGAGLLPGGELMLILRTPWLGHWEQRKDPFQGRRRVLVVDDSLTARAMHRNMLESGGYLVHSASSAKQALDLMKSSSYDLVLCDIGMEEMDGLAFTRVIKGDPKTRDLPVLLVSARDDDREVPGFLAAGAQAFLSKKDCNSGRLLSEVSKVLGPQGKRT